MLESKTVPNLLQIVLKRLESTYECGKITVTASDDDEVNALPGLVGHFLSMVAVSRQGVSEEEVLTVLNEVIFRPKNANERQWRETTGPAVCLQLWRQLHFATNRLLIQKTGRYFFSHDYVREAVTRRYLCESGDINSATVQRRAHAKLAAFFEVKLSSRTVENSDAMLQRIAMELPEQFFEAGVFDDSFIRILSHEPLCTIRYPDGELDVSYRRLGDKFGSSIARFLKGKPHHLRRFVMTGNNITAKFIKDLIDVDFPSAGVHVDIVLSHNAIKSVGTLTMVEFLRNIFRRLESSPKSVGSMKLDLSWCDLGNTGVRNILGELIIGANRLSGSRIANCIKCLDLRFNHVAPGKAEKDAATLKTVGLNVIVNSDDFIFKKKKGLSRVKAVFSKKFLRRESLALGERGNASNETDKTVLFDIGRDQWKLQFGEEEIYSSMRIEDVKGNPGYPARLVLTNFRLKLWVIQKDSASDPNYTQTNLSISWRNIQTLTVRDSGQKPAIYILCAYHGTRFEMIISDYEPQLRSDTWDVRRSKVRGEYFAVSRACRLFYRIHYVHSAYKSLELLRDFSDGKSYVSEATGDITCLSGENLVLKENNVALSDSHSCFTQLGTLFVTTHRVVWESLDEKHRHLAFSAPYSNVNSFPVTRIAGVGYIVTVLMHIATSHPTTFRVQDCHAFARYLENLRTSWLLKPSFGNIMIDMTNAPETVEEYSKYVGQIQNEDDNETETESDETDRD